MHANWISLNVDGNEMKHLVGFQMNVFNYLDFSLYWIPEGYFVKGLHLTARALLK